MRKIFLTFIKIISVCCLSTFLFLGGTTIVDKFVKGETPTPTISPTETPDISLYKDQISSLTTELDYMKEFNNKLLTTFYTSLGFVAVFLVSFLGYNWFVNNRKVEQEMMKVKQELNTEQSKGLKVIQTQSETKIKNSLLSINQTISRIQFDFYTLKGANYEGQGNFGNALSEYLHAISYCPDHGAIAYALEKINELILKEETYILPTEYSDITTAIGKISNEHDVLKNKIIENLRKRIH